RDVARREQDRGDAGLHVGDTAAVEPVAVRFTGERILGPGTRAERHGVEMAGEAERRLCIARPRARHDARAPGLVFVVGDAEAPLAEQRAGVARAFLLAARRVDGVVGEERPGERDNVGGAHVANDTKTAVVTARQRRALYDF